MNLYESNYLRLRALAGDLIGIAGTRHSRVADDCELVLTVSERTPYTSVLKLSYLLPPAGPPAEPVAVLERYPELRLRVYHDARLLEAEGGERELHHRWQRNLMLNKWLEYCTDRGHQFAQAIPSAG